jgi:dTMP kinase
MTKCRFISFEGIDGAGKSTQIRLLAERLRSAGHAVTESIEPGGTRLGREIRRLLLDPSSAGMAPAAELLLYFAARAQNVVETIRPALDRGDIVLSDRFTDSTMAYQGFARGLGTEPVRELHRIACGGVEPCLTLFLDIDLETSASRIERPDRMESESIEFRRRVREGYLRLIEVAPLRFVRLDGSPDPLTVAAAVWQAVERHV